MYDIFLAVNNNGKLSSKFLSGTLMVIETMGRKFVVFFKCRARTAIDDYTKDGGPGVI